MKNRTSIKIIIIVFFKKILGLLWFNRFFKQNISIKDVDFQIEMPRTIHQTYPNLTLPTEIQESIDSLKINNPGWEYALYDDQMALDYMTEHFPELVVYYQSINLSIQNMARPKQIFFGMF